MRRVLWILPLLFLWVFTAGMGGKPNSEIPLPEIDFKAVVRDDQDVTTKMNHASWDGNIFFTGTRGKGTVTISFEKVKKVASTGTGTNNKSDFQITLRSGEVVAVTFDNDAKLIGSTNFGTYRVFAKNIKEIVFE